MKKNAFARLLALALCMTAFAWNIAAFEPETPENADEIAISENAALTEEAQYAEKPASMSAEFGKLVYFNNGNDSDFVNDLNLTLKGLSETDTAVNGFHAHLLCAAGTTEDKVSLPYLAVVSQDGESITDADGNELNGTLTLCVDLYNNTELGYTFQRLLFSPKDGYSKLNYSSNKDTYFKWDNVAPTAKAWSTLQHSVTTPVNSIGFMKSSITELANMFIRSVYVYYAPTPVYAEKPAETNENYGTLVYFDNGNESDKINLANITVKGLTSDLTSMDGYVTRMLDENAKSLLFNGNTYGVVATSDNESFKFANGTAFPDGNITICLDIYDNTSDKGFRGVILPKPADTSWKEWCGFYTSWEDSTAFSGKWTTLHYTYNTGAHTLGLARTSTSRDELYIRSVSVYYNAGSVAVKTSDRNSIRTSGSAGIRFGGFVPAATLSDADEVGFLVARGDLLADKGLTPADEIQVSGTVTEKTDGAFTVKTSGGITLVGAKNYVKGGKNKTVEVSDGSTPFGDYGEQGSYFTGVVTSLDNGYTKNGTTYANRYDVPLTARAYVKIGSLYFYGDCSTKSVKEVAESIKKAGGAAYTANSEYIDNIIESAGKTVTE